MNLIKNYKKISITMSTKKYIFPLSNLLLSVFLLSKRIKNFKVNTFNESLLSYSREMLIILFFIFNIYAFSEIIFAMFFGNKVEITVKNSKNNL